MKKVLLIVVLVVTLLYWLLTSYFPDVEINRYDSIETVKENSVMEKGWIPKIVPASAYDIVETHDAHNHEIFGKFSYKERDEEQFLSNLKESNGFYEGEQFLFKIDKEKNMVSFRNKI
jgi:hypothetical protein